MLERPMDSLTERGLVARVLSRKEGPAEDPQDLPDLSPDEATLDEAVDDGVVQVAANVQQKGLHPAGLAGNRGVGLLEEWSETGA